MATKIELQDRLERLNRAIGSGIQTVSYADGRQTYRDLDEMFAARRDIERQIADIEGKSTRRRVVRLNDRSGL